MTISGRPTGGAGWLASLAGDFLEQFFGLPVVGPLLVALLLTAVGVVAYRICRRFLGHWPSLAIAILIFAWSFLRETGNNYMTCYTLAVLGYLCLVLLALQFKPVWLRYAAAQKYLGMLSRTLFYGKWARSRMPGRQDEAVQAELAKARARLTGKDFVHQAENPRAVLLGLLEADSTNTLARNYLLCYDLLCYDLDGFIRDYEPDRIRTPSRTPTGITTGGRCRSSNKPFERYLNRLRSMPQPIFSYPAAFRCSQSFS